MWYLNFGLCVLFCSIKQYRSLLDHYWISPFESIFFLYSTKYNSCLTCNQGVWELPLTSELYNVAFVRVRMFKFLPVPLLHQQYYFLNANVCLYPKMLQGDLWKLSVFQVPVGGDSKCSGHLEFSPTHYWHSSPTQGFSCFYRVEIPVTDQSDCVNHFLYCLLLQKEEETALYFDKKLQWITLFTQPQYRKSR